jgi:hypothetical protein
MSLCVVHEDYRHGDSSPAQVLDEVKLKECTKALIGAHFCCCRVDLTRVARGCIDVRWRMCCFNRSYC